jgi:hypothetical protein
MLPELQTFMSITKVRNREKIKGKELSYISTDTGVTFVGLLVCSK